MTVGWPETSRAPVQEDPDRARAGDASSGLRAVPANADPGGARPADNAASSLSWLVKSPPLRSAARSVRRAARYASERIRRCEGLPSGLDFATLDALCREHGRGGLTGCAHVRLSGWKPRGAYRLEVRSEAGASWRLIFKDECYGSEFGLIPALEGLPTLPGPPEAIVYQMRSPLLCPFLPELFWFREIQPGRHFQYLLADLAETHAELRPGSLDVGSDHTARGGEPGSERRGGASDLEGPGREREGRGG